MSSLADKLKAAVHSVTHPYSLAMEDLRSEVMSLALAIEEMTNGVASAGLVARDATDQHTITILVVTEAVRGQKISHEIQALTLSPAGYPIKSYLQTAAAGSSTTPNDILFDKESLHAYFETLAADPTSPLVMRLVFIMKRAEKNASE